VIAAFGMYDRPQTAAANDTLWAGVRDHLRRGGISAPDQLIRGDLALMAGWISPDLLISQTCSLPYRAKLRDHVQIIATPDYGLPDCPAGYYNSVYVARRADGFSDLAEMAGQDFAYNEALSHSGWAAPWADHQARGLILHPCLRTGSHHASALAVAQGRADYAAIDALTWDMITEYDDFAANLCVIDHTPASPALPFVTALNRPLAPLYEALLQTIKALDATTRKTLRLRGLIQISKTVYLEQPIPPQPAHRQSQ
jgi:ABC-type phosphate/phosphonate transport system substrate-binding protein